MPIFINDHSITCYVDSGVICLLISTDTYAVVASRSIAKSTLDVPLIAAFDQRIAVDLIV